MAKSKTKRAKATAPYIRRAVEDEYVQDQLRNAVSRLRDVYGRISKKQAAAAEDKRMYRSLQEAAVSIRKAVGRIEEPPKPKHRLRNLLIVGVAGGGALLALKRSRGENSQQSQDWSAAGAAHPAASVPQQPAEAPATA